tara:strand:+ start:5329 stop:7686 length:2358 start_codon:yes stop_codon:yes gene_type:complete
MADLFAPKLQAEVAYERPIQPVETPSAIGALAGLGEFFVSQYDREQAGGGSKRATSIDPNLAVFAEGLKEIEGLRDKRGEFDTAALIAERQLAKNFAVAGIEFDTDYQNVYTATTGRPWAGYGRDPEAFMMQNALQDSDVQASFIASYAVLPEDATDEQRIEYAIGQKATVQAAADVIARSKAEAGYKWSVQTEAAYAEAVDTFVNVGMGGLVQTTQSGQRVGPQSIANLQAQWAQYKVQLSRPTAITDDQWKATQAKIANVDNMFTMLTTASSSDVLFEEITTAFSAALLAEGGGSTESILAAASAIKDPTSLMNLMGGNVETFVMDVSKSINLDIAQPQLFSHILDMNEVPLGGEIEGDATIPSLPPEVEAKISGLSPQEHFDALKASGKLTSLTDNNSLQRPEGRQQFVENAASIGAVMMSMENDEFLSSSFLRQLVANPNFIQNISNLDGVDPEGAVVARTYVRTGLNTELVRQERNLASIEGNSLASWNGNNYDLDMEALSQRASGIRIQEFTRSLDRYYGGDLAVAVEDGFKRMTDVTDVVQVAGLYNLEQALDRRTSIGVINETLNALSTGEEVSAIVRDVQETVVPPAVEGINVPEEVRIDAPFLNEVNRVAEGIPGIDSTDLLRIIGFETIGSFSPSEKSRTSSATGLIQFLEKTAKGLGTTTSELAAMSREEQMKFVEAYLKPYKNRIKNFGDLYMAIHYPRGIGKDDDYVLYRRGSDAYDANKSLDVSKDGTVTRREAIARASSFGVPEDQITEEPVSSAPMESLRPMARPTGE